MLDELRTFVVFADAGSLHKTAGRLFLTPSAVTRQIQRLEAALDAPLLDRRLKPARLTPAGRAVLERSRELLRSLDELKAAASPSAEPAGSLRFGLSHALAQPGLVRSIERLRRRFPGLETTLASDVTERLLERVAAAELEVALVLVPAESSLPTGVPGTVLATERFAVFRRRSRSGGRSQVSPMEGPWILNPRGCLIREAFERHLEELGVPLRIAAEVMNIEMQLSLVAAGVGQAILPARFAARHPRRERLTFVRAAWELDVSVALVRAGHLGRLQAVAAFLEEELRAHLARRPRPS